MIKTDEKGNITGFICTKEDIDYTNFDKETMNYYDDFLIPSYEKEIDRLTELCNKYEEEHKTTYEIWKKDISLYNSVVDERDRLQEELDKTRLSELEKEYVISELKKWLNDGKEFAKENNDDKGTTLYRLILDKIKELRGDKE